MALFIPTAAMGPAAGTALHANAFGMDATSTAAVLTEHLIESTSNWIHQQQRQQQQRLQSLPAATYQFNSLHRASLSSCRHVSRHNPLHASNHLHHHRQLHQSRQVRRLSNHPLSLVQSNHSSHSSQQQQSQSSPSHQSQQSHLSNSLSSDSIVQLVNPSNMPTTTGLTLLVANGSSVEGNVHHDLPSSSSSPSASLSLATGDSSSSPVCDAVNNALFNAAVTTLSRFDGPANNGTTLSCLHLPNNVTTPLAEPSAERRSEFVDLHKGKPIRLKVKVLIPIDDHPNFNFVGKLLGPKGQSLKWLQEHTQTKMTILGKGSMRDKQKEEELRSDIDPKYSHLRQDLHVEITAFASAPEAYSRIGHALEQIKRFLVPDYYDEIRQQQLKELGIILPERKSASSGSINGNNNILLNNVSSPLSSSSCCDVTSDLSGGLAPFERAQGKNCSAGSPATSTSPSLTNENVQCATTGVNSNESVCGISYSHQQEQGNSSLFRASAHHHHHHHASSQKQQQQQQQGYQCHPNHNGKLHHHQQQQCHHHLHRHQEHLRHHADTHAIVCTNQQKSSCSTLPVTCSLLSSVSRVTSPVTSHLAREDINSAAQQCICSCKESVKRSESAPRVCTSAIDASMPLTSSSPSSSSSLSISSSTCNSASMDPSTYPVVTSNCTSPLTTTHNNLLCNSLACEEKSSQL